MLAAFVSLSVMVFVLLKFATPRDEPPPTRPVAAQPHAGATHHTEEKHEGNKLAPLQVFATSKVGDWHAFDTTMQLANSRPTTTTSLIVIEAADDKQVRLLRSERESSLTPPNTARDQRPREGLTIDALAGKDANQWTLYGLTISDDVHEVGGRSFKCKKLVFSLDNPMDAKQHAEVEMWISDEVPAGGLVELHQSFAHMQLTMTHRLVGFGDAKSTAWGKKPDGLGLAAPDLR